MLYSLYPFPSLGLSVVQWLEVWILFWKSLKGLEQIVPALYFKRSLWLLYRRDWRGPSAGAGKPARVLFSTVQVIWAHPMEMGKTGWVWDTFGRSKLEGPANG